MAITWKWLNKTNLTISDTAEAIVTNPAATKTFIPSIVLHNAHSSTVEVTLYVVPNVVGTVGTAADGNEVFKYTLAVNETYTLTDLKVLLDGTNDTLQAVAGTADVVTIFVNGWWQT